MKPVLVDVRQLFKVDAEKSSGVGHLVSYSRINTFFGTSNIGVFFF